jgi:intracellular multiplication protein IcmF
MDNSLRALCDALKKVISQLKPQHHALSFLLLIGKDNQGKSTLLRQSHYEHLVVDNAQGDDIYYNQHGIILELGETWLNQSNHILQHTLKQLNRCHSSLKISGIILCIDINELLITEPIQFLEQSKQHTQLLMRFGQSLNYRLDTALIFTKLDAIAGFCEFFQNDHATELKKPLGFSLNWALKQGKYVSNYKTKFEQFIEVLGQQVIYKMHPARSSIKRTLIREFPLQLASLGRAIQILIQTISPKLFHLQAIYFTSGEQGGVSIDRLTKKIQHEYALTVQDRFPQSVNHRAYFIEGALTVFQAYTKRPPAKIAIPNKWVLGTITGAIALTFLWLGTQYFKSTRLLDEASKELLTYDLLMRQQNNDPSIALYHLTKASAVLDQLAANSLSLSTVQQLKTQLHLHTKQHLQEGFLPAILAEVEQALIDTKQSQRARYHTLKIYLMLGDPTKFSQAEVLEWFRLHAQNTSEQVMQKKMALLKQVLKQPLQPIAINQQIVNDVRNYLNALPVSYLYYTLAKSEFPQENQPIVISGFDLAEKSIPVYFTKAGFKQILKKLPAISAQLQTDNWVLARQDLTNLPMLLQQAYCYDYTVWWQNFMRKSLPLRFKEYQQAIGLTQALNQGNSIDKLIEVIQQQTSPELGENASLFNQEIASKFTSLSLMSHSAIHDLSININELEKFLTTLSVVNDQGRTIFNLVKTRFEGDAFSNPLSALYNYAHQLPEPVSNWAKQIADDTWFLLINDCRNYINTQWQQTVLKDYQNTIARRYPFDASQSQEVAVTDFNHFFARHGVLNSFIEQYLKPFLDTSQAQWQLKELNNYVLPISPEMINELIRANVITTMFFPDETETSKIDFSLQKLSLDPVVASLQLMIGNTKLRDTQDTEALINFHWPQSNAKLSLHSIEGNHYELDEAGPWAFFKMLQKVNVLVDEQDNSSLQILFEINGNSGRYILKTQNQINPFIPGILNGFTLNESIA